MVYYAHTSRMQCCSLSHHTGVIGPDSSHATVDHLAAKFLQESDDRNEFTDMTQVCNYDISVQLIKFV